MAEPWEEGTMSKPEEDYSTETKSLFGGVAMGGRSNKQTFQPFDNKVIIILVIILLCAIGSAIYFNDPSIIKELWPNLSSSVNTN